MKTYAVTFIISIFILCGCKKDDNNVTETENPTGTESTVVFPNPKNIQVLLSKGGLWQMKDTLQWQTVYNNLDGIKFYINEFVDNNHLSLEDKQDFIKILKAKNIKIAVEAGGLLTQFHDEGDLVAEYSFNDEWQKIEKLITPVEAGGLGGYLDIIDFDGPIRRVLCPKKDFMSPHQNIDLAVSEFVELVGLWRAELPNLEVNYTPSFPNFGWKGEPSYLKLVNCQGQIGYADSYEILTKMDSVSKANNIVIDGLTLVNGYDYAAGLVKSNQEQAIADIDWVARIKDAHTTVKGFGWDFNLVLTTQGDSHDGKSKDEIFLDHALAFIDLYGASPQVDGYTLQSWYGFPSELLPETKEFTATYAAKEVLEKVKN